jgi:N-acetylmuramoyl-L-alanine amidase
VVIAAAVVTGLGAVRQRQAASPKDLYTSAQAREQLVRATHEGASADRTAALREFRSVIDSYRAIVWQYPNSGYCDNALWQGAHIAADAFGRFGEERDRQTAVAMLNALVSEYPSSGFVSKAKAEAARLDHAAPPARVEAAVSQAAGIAGREASPAAIATARDAAPVGVPPGARSAGTNELLGQAAAPDAGLPGRPTGSARDVLSARESPLVSVRAIRRTTGEDAVQVTIELDGPAPYREERLDQPPRVFFDLANTRTEDPLRDAVLTYDTDVVRQIRVGRHPNHVTRIGQYRARFLREPFRLVIDCYRVAPGSELPKAAPAPRTEPGKANPPAAASREPANGPAPRTEPGRANPPALSSRETSSGSARLPARVPTIGGEGHVVPSPEPPPALPIVAGIPVSPESSPKADVPSGTLGSPTHVRASASPASTVLPAAPASNLSGGYSLARQLGLGVGRIVIDAGHGGRDPGALGAGVTEAEITLDIALRLEKLLLKEPGLEVVMTRRTDAYVPLEERTAIANRAGADLFVSIHCNAARDAAINGVETYSLNFASTAHAATVAARENAAASLPMSSLSEIVRVIALNSKFDESRDLARQVQVSLVRRLRAQQLNVRDLGVKQAPFVVLVGASMPSVLAEVAFITNKQEGRLLASETYRQRAAEALLEGISRYQRSLKKTQIASQQPASK